MLTHAGPSQMDSIPLVVTVGISGHRKRSQLGDLSRVRTLLRERFRDLRDQLIEANGPVEFLLLSPLADGADRIFVDALREEEPDAHLLVPMPFDRDAYERSFGSEDSAEDFRRRVADPRTRECFTIPGGREGEYLRLGRWVVDHADLMFFLHDGSDYDAAPMDGGTSSVIHYAWSDGDLPGTDDRKGHPVYVYIDTGDGTAITRGLIRPNPHVRHLVPGGHDHLDARAARHQRRFDLSITTIITLAFATGVIVLLDWWSGGNDVFEMLGGLARVVNWDSLATLALVILILLVVTARRRGALRDWVESRYLAERLRTLPELLAAGIPLSRVLEQSRRDPAGSQMARAWHSLFLAGRTSSIPGGDGSDLPPGALRARLLSPDSFLTDQIAWHLRKAAAKERLQRRWTWTRNFLFACSAATSALAALQYGAGIATTGDLANHLDFASSLLSLLLASAAAMAQVKEHGRVAVRYRDTIRRLSELRRTIRFVETGEGPSRQEELQDLVIEGTEILMETTYAWMDTMMEKDPEVA